MIGIVLAAGKGKRLRPLTETRPKVLLPILGQPLISRSLELLKSLKIDKIVVVVSYLKDMVVREVKRLCDELRMDVDFVDQGEEKGTAHAVSSALRNYMDDAVIVYGDLYLEPQQIASKLIKVFDTSSYDGAVLGVKVNDVSRYGELVVDGDRVVDIVEKPSKRGPGLVNAGIYFFKEKVLELVDEIQLSVRGEYEFTDIIRLAKARGYSVTYIEIDSMHWHDVGYPWDLIEVNKRELEKLSDKRIRGDVDRLATVKGPIVVEEGAVIRGATFIEGPVYIGRDAVIGPNAYLRPYSVILDRARIGFSVEVKESIVMEHVRAAHLAYIGDSIVGEETNLGAGTILANLRFDEKTIKVTIDGKRIDSGRKKLGAIIGGYVKTGVNVSIMPGVKIGSYAIIYPGVTVYKDVPPKTIVREDWK